MAIILDGSSIAKLKKEILADDIKKFRDRTSVIPHLAVILIGVNPASCIYVKNKNKAGEHVGMKVNIHHLPQDVKTVDVLSLIKELNNDKSVHGILLQLPIPGHLDPVVLSESIDPSKDVDGLHPYNLGSLMSCNPYIMPCTPQACLHLIEETCVAIEGKNVVVMGCSILVGRPLASLLINHNATVTSVHIKSVDVKNITKRADILIVAIGSPRFVTADFVKEGSIVIDVGINRLHEQGEEIILGDVDFDSVFKKVSYITPVPGGVGPMTVYYSLLNTFKAAVKQTINIANPI
ncbi:MAG: bifunctional 5,10-methylenetetrahydrofolate dehydrogenase/5,10-methenyltetrahydrofolate cyclohydrolase [Alphaproteobacteria bacterium]